MESEKSDFPASAVTQEAGQSVEELLAIQQEDILHIEIGGKDLLVRAADVTEIVRPTSLTPVPMGPEHLLGLANVHGQIVCMVNPSKVLQLPPIQSSPTVDTRFMLLRHAKMHIGIWVDKVHALYAVNSELVPTSTSAEGEIGMEIEGRYIDMLDCAALFH